MAKHLCYRCMKHMVEDGETCLCGFHLKTYLEDTHHLIPGTVLKGRYQVGAAIGEGGFGITYIGMDTLFSQKVAIKEFYIREFVNRNNTVTANVSVITGNSVSTFDNFKAKFISEAKTLAKFSAEEGIVSVIDYFEENNTAYIVMEYLEGQTLRAYLKKEQILPWGRTLQILTPVMKSLSKVHAEGIVHRDIAPDNIMLTADGKVKLLDFGAARVVDSGDLHSRSMVLKQGYAPMEQYRSNGNLQGSWTDVYALCATIYVCVTGILPEDGMERYIEDHLKPAHTLVNCPKEFSDILMKGMAVRYQDRYQTVGELYEAFTTMFKKPEPEVKPEEPEEEKTVIAAKIHKPEPSKEETPKTEPPTHVPPSPEPKPFEGIDLTAAMQAMDEGKKNPSSPSHPETPDPVGLPKAQEELKNADFDKVINDLFSPPPIIRGVNDGTAADSSDTPPVQKAPAEKKKSVLPAVIGVLAAAVLLLVLGSRMFAGSSAHPEEMTGSMISSSSDTPTEPVNSDTSGDTGSTELTLPPKDQTFEIGVMQLIENPLLDQATMGFEDEIYALLGDQANVNVQLCGGDSAQCALAANNFYALGSDLIFANTTQCLQAASAAMDDVPIIGASVYDYQTALGFDIIPYSYFEEGTTINVSGVCDSLSAAVVADTIQTIDPDAETVGFLINMMDPSSNPPIVNIMDHLNEYAQYSIYDAYYDSPQGAAESLRALAENCDVIYVGGSMNADVLVEIMQCMETDLAGTDLLIVGDNEARMKEFATVCMQQDYYEAGKQAADMAVRVLAGEDISTMPVEYPNVVRHTYNPERAARLNITVPSDYEPMD